MGGCDEAKEGASMKQRRQFPSYLRLVRASDCKIAAAPCMEVTHTFLALFAELGEHLQGIDESSEVLVSIDGVGAIMTGEQMLAYVDLISKWIYEKKGIQPELKFRLLTRVNRARSEMGRFLSA